MFQCVSDHTDSLASPIDRTFGSLISVSDDRAATMRPRLRDLAAQSTMLKRGWSTPQEGHGSTRPVPKPRPRTWSGFRRPLCSGTSSSGPVAQQSERRRRVVPQFRWSSTNQKCSLTVIFSSVGPRFVLSCDPPHLANRNVRRSTTVVASHKSCTVL